MPARLLLDLSHTSHTRARTGIQRVARALRTHWGEAALSVTLDPYERTWRPLRAWEEANLVAEEAAASRGSSWPLGARLGGRLRRLSGSRAQPLAADALVVPELFSPAVALALPALFAQVRGPRVALFHDAIALRMPESAAAKTVARFPAYLRELLSFDGIAAISEESRDSLVDYWRWLGVSDCPPVETIALGTDPRPAAATPVARPHPELLCVSSLEGRKNHVALLQACESLWSQERRFSLTLIGLAHPVTGRPALELIETLKARGRPLAYLGPVSEAELDRAYRQATATIYPSLAEGFGLPVIESVSRSVPCLCSAHGAVGESARGGGCLTLESLQAEGIAAGIEAILSNPGLVDQLRAAAGQRVLKTWATYATEVADWTLSLRPKRNRSQPLRLPSIPTRS